jgi:hypothetical protein
MKEYEVFGVSINNLNGIIGSVPNQMAVLTKRQTTSIDALKK